MKKGSGELIVASRRNITTLSYTLFQRYPLTIKFKVRTKIKDKNNMDVPVLQEYSMGKVNDNYYTESLNPKSFMEIDLADKDTNGIKEYITLSELLRARLIRKLTKMAQILEQYDSQEIDIVKYDTTGERIDSRLTQPVTLEYFDKKLSFTIAMSEMKLPCVAVSLNDNVSTISIQDFLNIFYRIREFNFSIMTMELINYVNGFENLPIDVVDFRKGGAVPNKEIDISNIKNTYDASKFRQYDDLTVASPDTEQSKSLRNLFIK